MKRGWTGFAIHDLRFTRGVRGRHKVPRGRARALGHAKAVETGGVVRPVGIAEIGRAAGEGDGLQRRPDGIGQVRAGFHYDYKAVGGGDVEPKSIRLNAKAGTTGLHLRVP